MTALRPVLLLTLLTLSFQMPGHAEDPKPGSLSAARKGFQTKLIPRPQKPEPIETAPARVFRTVSYPAASGRLGAYLTPDPADGKRHPAILWITGGDCNSISDDHFNILAPVNELIAQAILRDTGERCSVKLEAGDVNRHFDASRKPRP